MSITSGVFANKWKISRIIPLWKGKGKDKLLAESYRPVQLLPSISKLVEKTVQEQLYEHMEREKLWNPNHHSYRTAHSTTTALGQLTDLFYEASDQKKNSVAMSVGESAAFDCLNHNMILQKLALYKCDSTTITWIKSYLENRQGSILGPTLFNIFINELPDVVN